MDSKLYRELLVNSVFPLAAKGFNFNCSIHQDNDSKHSSQICKQILDDFNIEWVLIYIIEFILLVICYFLEKGTTLFTRP
jgi:ubiquitin-protein ligase